MALFSELDTQVRMAAIAENDHKRNASYSFAQSEFFGSLPETIDRLCNQLITSYRRGDKTPRASLPHFYLPVLKDDMQRSDKQEEVRKLIANQLREKTGAGNFVITLTCGIEYDSHILRITLTPY